MLSWKTYKTSKPRTFYALYIGANDGGTGHSVFKLSTKSMIVTPRCKPIPILDDVIEVVNQMGQDDRLPDGIVFCNIHKESTVEEMYGYVDSQDDISCASDTSWDKLKTRVKQTKRLSYTMMIWIKMKPMI